MKLKKIVKYLEDTQEVRIWGKDHKTPLFYGYIMDIPDYIKELKLYEDIERDAVVEFRTNCIDCSDHYSITVKEK